MAGTEKVTQATNCTESAFDEEVVRENLPLVGYLVAEVASKLPGHVKRDDLTSAGMLALTQSARAFDPTRGVPFARFATVRIRGALIDELRSHDWASRSVRMKARQRATAEEELAARLRRHPTPTELAAHLGISVHELASVEEDVHRAVVLSLQGFSDAGTLEGMLPDDDAGPEEVLLYRERTAYLADSVAALPDRLRVVVESYFFNERPMAEIAVELGVTESRISQMRAEALAMLKDGMTAMLAPEELPDQPRPDGAVARRKAAYYATIAARSDFRARLSVRQMPDVDSPRRASGAA